MEDARNTEKNGHWIPDDETREDMKLVCNLQKCYASGFWYSHAAGDRALRTVASFLAGIEPHISEKTWESAKHAVRGKLKMIKSPKFVPGDKCFVRGREQNSDGYWENTKCFGIICSGAMVGGHSIVYDVLVNGKCQPVDIDRINKR